MRNRKIIEKQEKQQAEIIAKIMPIVDEKRYGDMTIREICNEAGISTGMFYRHFQSKNDLLSIAYINKLRSFLDNAESHMKNMTFREQLIYLKAESSLLASFLGPDGIMIYINKENEECDCSVPRGMVDERIIEIFNHSKVTLPKGKTIQNILDDITVLQKGIQFEWYTKGNEYDFEKETRRMITEMVNSFFPEK